MSVIVDVDFALVHTVLVALTANPGSFWIEEQAAHGVSGIAFWKWQPLCFLIIQPRRLRQLFYKNTKK